MKYRSALALAAALAATGCAAPPLRIYTLDTPSPVGQTAPSSPHTQVAALSRVQVPDYLDTQDIVLRTGQELQRSHHGRWASRLSLGITAAVAQRLAERWPNLIVTDAPQSQTPAFRIQITVARFDVTEDGRAVLDASWTVTPADANRPVRQDRAALTATGPVATDADTARLMRSLIVQLADRIDKPVR